MATQKNKTKSVLMELRPCFAGYSGIPQDTRITYSLLADMEGIELGGHVLDAYTGTAGFSWNERADGFQMQRQEAAHIVALEGRSIAEKDFSSVPWFVGFILKFKINVFLKTYIFNVLFNKYSALHEISTHVFDDYIWRRLFEKTLPSKKMEVVLQSKFLMGSLSYRHLSSIAAYGLPAYKINTKGWDVYISQTPFPANISKGTQLVVRYHDAFPVEYPHLISDPYYHNKLVSSTLEKCRSDAWFACNSKSSRKSLIDLMPELEARSGVVYCAVTEGFYEEKYDVREIISTRRISLDVGEGLKRVQGGHKEKTKEVTGDNYYLCVGTFEPRKNYEIILKAWRRFRNESGDEVKLVIVGNKGWGMEHAEGELRQGLDSGLVCLLGSVPLDELRKLYSNARATIIASYAEGFSYSGIESMRCKTLVLASGIDTHQEIYEGNALFFNPYSVDMLVEKMIEEKEISSKERNKKINNAYDFSLKYSEENQRKQWSEFFSRL
jgi:hypothetical protein